MFAKKFLLFRLLFLVTIFIPNSSFAQAIFFNGNSEQFFVWNRVEIIKDSTHIVYDIHDGYLSIDSIPSGVYDIIFTSRFNARVNKRIKVHEHRTTNVKLPSLRSLDSIMTVSPMLETMRESDTLEVFFTQRNCIVGYLYIHHAIITKQHGCLIAVFNKDASEGIDTIGQIQYKKELSDKQLELLMEIDNDLLKPQKGKGCSTDPVYYFYLNGHLKISKIYMCLSLTQFLES